MEILTGSAEEEIYEDKMQIPNLKQIEYQTAIFKDEKTEAKPQSRRQVA